MLSGKLNEWKNNVEEEQSTVMDQILSKTSEAKKCK